MANRPNPLPGAPNNADKVRNRGGARADATGGNDGAAATDRQADKLASLLDQYGAGGFRLLCERTDASGVARYLGSVPFDSELYETVRQRWGGSGTGLYGGRIVDERGKYQTRLPAFGIEGKPIVPGDDSAPAGNQSNGNAAATPAVESVLLAVVRTLERIEQRANAAPAADPVEQVTRIAKALREANPTPATVPASVVDPIATMRQMYGFMQELRESAAPAAPDNNFGVVLRESVQSLAQVLDKKLDIDAAREIRRGGKPVSATATVTASGTPAPTDTVHTAPVPTDKLAQLLLTLPMPARRFLLTCAENGEDADDYVPMLLNRLTDEAYEEMRIQIQRADFLDVLCTTIPAYEAHREWFGGLVLALRAAFDEPADDAAAATAEQSA